MLLLNAHENYLYPWTLSFYQFRIYRQFNFHQSPILAVEEKSQASVRLIKLPLIINFGGEIWFCQARVVFPSLAKSKFPAKMDEKFEFYQANTISIWIIETENCNNCPRETHNYVIQCLKSVNHYSFNIRQHLRGLYNSWHNFVREI